MNDERIRSQVNSIKTSRLSTYSTIQHFDFLDTRHSVFSKNSYYHDMRSIHPWSRRPCSRSSGIPLTTLRTRSCSARIENLAKPKIKHERLIRQEFFDNFTNYSYSGVTSAALTAQCSDRLTALAQPKKSQNDYILPRPISEQALQTQISDRINDLAKPRHNTIRLNTIWKNQQK